MFFIRGGAHRGAFKKFEYLGEIETKFENILANMLIRGLDGLDSCKNGGKKSCYTLPFVCGSRKCKTRSQNIVKTKSNSSCNNM